MAKTLRDIVPKVRKFVPDIPHNPQYPDRDKAQRKFEKLHTADEHDDRQGNGDDVRKGAKQKGPNYPTPGQVDSTPEKLKRDGSQLGEETSPHSDGDDVIIDYGQHKGKKGRITDTSPSGEYHVVKHNKGSTNYHYSDLKKLNEDRTPADQGREAEKEADRERDELRAKGKKLPRRLTGEEVEQIDEISKKTLGSYIKKASRDAGEAEARASAAYTRDRKLNNKVVSRLDDKADRRYAGIDAATKRLTKED